MGPERRGAYVILAAAFLTVGSLLWVSVHPYGWIPGAILVVFGLVVFLSVLTGVPFASLQADVEEPSTDGIPWHAPVDYQVDQLRQIIPQFNGDAFDEPNLMRMIPKARRARKRPFHEPFQNMQWREGIEVLVGTGELEVISNGCWRATGKKPPILRLRKKRETEA
jgi:hypothetical protein